MARFRRGSEDRDGERPKAAIGEDEDAPSSSPGDEQLIDNRWSLGGHDQWTFSQSMWKVGQGMMRLPLSIMPFSSLATVRKVVRCTGLYATLGDQAGEKKDTSRFSVIQNHIVQWIPHLSMVMHAKETPNLSRSAEPVESSVDPVILLVLISSKCES